ncbi:hypothetical protein GCM10020001_054640 [Nonomuraea salmonea]
MFVRDSYAIVFPLRLRCMDVLSDVVASMRAGVPRSARVEWPARWGAAVSLRTRLGGFPRGAAGLVLGDPAGR